MQGSLLDLLAVFFFSKKIKIWCANSHTGVRKKKLGSLKIFLGIYIARITVCHGTRICAPAIDEPVRGRGE